MQFNPSNAQEDAYNTEEKLESKVNVSSSFYNRSQLIIPE